MNNAVVPTSNGHHSDPVPVKAEANDSSSRVTVRSGVAKAARDKGAIMEQDIDGLEYSSEEEPGKATDDFEDILTMRNTKSKAVS